MIVTLSPTDDLSGVVATYWQLDGGPLESGTSVPVSGEGVYTLTFWSEDAAGNVEPAQTTVVMIDLTPPTITLQWPGASISDGQVFYYGDVPPAPTCTASDLLSGVVGSCTVTGYGTAVESYVLTAYASDHAGNVASLLIYYSVLGWTASGFYQPVDMTIGSTPVYNVVKAGSTVPHKFEGFKGTTELTDVGIVVQPLTAKVVSCVNGALSDDIELTATGGTSLRYDTTAGQFIYNWQTPKTGAGKCYQVGVKLVDGSTLTAFFKLK